MFCSLCGSENPSSPGRCRACGASLGARSSAEAGQSEAASADALASGTVLAGTYAVERVLGQGGFGITYKCHDQMLDRRIAVKEFFPSGCRREQNLVLPSRGSSSTGFSEARAQFLTEARLLARCHHPGIVAVHAAFEDNQTAYMVMELLHGPSVAQLLETRGGQLSEAQALPIIERTGQALGFVHDLGLLHRDIKPENIIVCDDGRVMLIDFGTAREYVKGQAQGHTIVVTPGYAPLEQYAREAQRGAFTDVYGLAATLYHLLTGQVPPAASDRAMGVLVRPVREENPKVSPGVARAVEAGLQMQIARRPQSVREFLELMHAPASEEAAALAGFDAPEKTMPWEEGLGVFAAPAPAFAPFAPVALSPVAPQPPAPQPAAVAPRIVFSTPPASTPAASTPPASTPAPAPFQYLGSGGIATKPPAPDYSVFWGIGAIGLVILGTIGVGSLSSTSPNFSPQPSFSTSTSLSPNFSTSTFSPNFPSTSSPVEHQGAETEFTPTIAPVSVQTLPGSTKTPLPKDAKAPDFISQGLAEFSPDGKRLAYLDSQGIVRVWNLATHRVVRSLPQLKSRPPAAMNFSRDGKMLALTQDKPGVGSLFDQVSVWNLGSGKSLGTLDVAPDTQWIHSQTITSDGQALVVTGPYQDYNKPHPRRSAFWWNPSTGTRIPAPLQKSADFVHLRLSGDGKELITGDDTGHIRWLDARTGATKAEAGTNLTWRDFQASPFYTQNTPSGVTLDDSLPVRAMRLSGNGSFLGVGNGAQIQVFNANAREVGHVPSGSIATFAVSPDGGFVVEQSQQNNQDNLLLWNLHSGRKTRLAVPSTGSGQLNAVDFSPDGKQVMGLFSDLGRISLLTWRADVFSSPRFSHPQVASSGSTSSPSANASALSSAGQLVATRDDGWLEIRRWDGSLSKRLAVGSSHFWEMDFSPDGQFLSARAFTGEVRLWNVQTGQEAAPLITMEANQTSSAGYVVDADFKSMAFSSDHSLLARVGTITRKNIIEVWSVGSTSRLLASITASEPVTTFAFSPDKESLIYGDDKGILRSVDIATQKTKAQIKNGSTPVSDIVFTAQGMMVVDRGKAFTVTLYDFPFKDNSSRSSKNRPVFQKKKQMSLDESDRFDRLAISSEGQYLATANSSNLSGGSIKIWHFPTGALLQKLSIDTTGVEAIAFSPDGTRLTCLNQTSHSSQDQLTTWQSVPALK